MGFLNIARKNNPSAELRRAAAAWDPFREMRQMMAWDPFAELTTAEPTGTYVPSFEVKETLEGYTFKADVPGVLEKDLDITLSGDRLMVSGKREAEKKEERDTYYVFERSYGSFSRTFTLPSGVNPDGVRAELKSGVLTVFVPKLPEVQPRQVPVQGEAKAKG